LRVINHKTRISNEIPDDALEALARCLYPAIVSYFESEAGQREFDEWKSRRNAENSSAPTESTPFQEAV